MVEKAQTLVKAEYTASSYAALETAIEEGIAVLDNKKATPKEVANALANINTAIEGLVKVDPPKTGDNTNITFLMGTLLLSMGAFVALKKKKNMEEK